MEEERFGSHTTKLQKVPYYILIYKQLHHSEVLREAGRQLLKQATGIRKSSGTVDSPTDCETSPQCISAQGMGKG